MGKMLYSATMSLDGFIAGPGGDMSWLTEHLGPNPAVDEVIGEIGTLLVGNRTSAATIRTSKGVVDKEGKPFGGGWEGPQFVLTHPPEIPAPGDHPGGTNVKLERISLTHAPGATNLWRRVVG